MTSLTLPLTPASAFEWPFPEEMKFEWSQFTPGFWSSRYRQAVVACRQREAELAEARSWHRQALKREAQLELDLKEAKGRLKRLEKD